MIEKLTVAKLALISVAFTLALTVNAALAHAGHGHEEQSAGGSWMGRLDDVGLAGGILLAFGLIYWASNRSSRSDEGAHDLPNR